MMAFFRFGTETWETLLFKGAVVCVRLRLEAWFRSAFSYTEPELIGATGQICKIISILLLRNGHAMQTHCVRMLVMHGMRKGAGNS